MQTIFILEDDLDILMDTKSLLEGEGFKVICCSSIVKAKEIIRKGIDVDLMFTDLNLITTGLEDSEVIQSYGSMIAGWVFLNNYIYTQEKYRDVPYIIYSAYIDELCDYMSSMNCIGKERFVKEACFQKTDEDSDIVDYIKNILE